MQSYLKQQEMISNNRQVSKEAEKDFLKDSGIITSDHFMAYAVMMQALDTERLELERQVLALRLANQALTHQLQIAE